MEHLDHVCQYNVYNADETGLFQLVPSTTNTFKGDKSAGGKHGKLRVTVVLSCKVDGTDRRLPFVIGKSKEPRGFRTYIAPSTTSASEASDNASQSCGVRNKDKHFWKKAAAPKLLVSRWQNFWMTDE